MLLLLPCWVRWSEGGFGSSVMRSMLDGQCHGFSIVDEDEEKLGGASSSFGLVARDVSIGRGDATDVLAGWR